MITDLTIKGKGRSWELNLHNLKQFNLFTGRRQDGINNVIHSIASQKSTNSFYSLGHDVTIVGLNSNSEIISQVILDALINRDFHCDAYIHSFPDNSILLLDNIASNFHYSELNTLWQELITLCKRKNCQVFATTQRLDVVQNFANVCSSNFGTCNEVSQVILIDKYRINVNAVGEEPSSFATHFSIKDVFDRLETAERIL